jgi:cobalt-zinc-cadmium efflux system membrane fusion protein
LKSHRILLFSGFALSLVAAAAAGLYYGRSTAPAPPVAPTTATPDDHDTKQGGDAHSGKTEAGHGEDDGHGHGAAEVSDLDRPVEELFAGKCEHEIPHHTCDECRYELGVVRLDAAVVSKEGKPGLVDAIPAGTASFEDSVRLTGEVHVSDARTVHVSSPLPGVVLNSPAQAGQRVTTGDVLFELDSHDVAEAKTDLLKKAAVLELATKTAEREALLFEKKISAEMEVQEARSRQAEARIELEGATSRLTRLGVAPQEHPVSGAGAGDALSGRVAVRASRAGTVLEGHANPGEYVEAGKELFVVSDLSEVWVWADLKDADLAAVSAAGKAPAAMVEGPAGIIVRGNVDVVSGTVSEQTRTARARIVVPNPNGVLRPGMFVTVRIAGPGGGAAVAVPKVAVLADEGRTFVFVHHEGDYWVRRPVTLGRRLDDKVEIVAGLAPGQRIIADGSFLLKSDVLRSKMGAGCAD